MARKQPVSESDPKSSKWSWIDTGYGALEGFGEWVVRLSEILLVTAVFTLAAAHTGNIVLKAISVLLFLGAYLHAMRPIPSLLHSISPEKPRAEGAKLQRGDWVIVGVFGITICGLGYTAIHALRTAIAQVLNSGLIS